MPRVLAATIQILDAVQVLAWQELDRVGGGV
jgi:hypothetical protein